MGKQLIEIGKVLTLYITIPSLFVVLTIFVVLFIMGKKMGR